MYDHESNSFSSNSLRACEFGNIVRIKDKIKFASSSKSSSPDNDAKLPQHQEQVIARLRHSSEGVWIKDTCKRSVEEDGLWFPLGRVGNQSREELKFGDIFRLGKRIYKVLKIQLKDQQNSVSVEDEIENVLKQKTVTIRKDFKNPPKCRICHTGLPENNHPLINPCGCSGTVGQMHANCFRMWVCTKLEVAKEKNSLSVAWKSLKCELCNQSLATSMNVSEETVALLNFKKVLVAPYMIVKQLSDDTEGNHNVHVFGLQDTDKKPLQLGRSNEIDFQIQDISVSRIHAELSLTKNKVYLQDKGSRFGTLVLKGKGIKLNEETLESPWFQIGRTLIRFKLKRPWSKVLPWLKSMVTSSNKKVDQRKISPIKETLDSEASDTDVSNSKSENRSTPEKRSDKTMEIINEEDEADSIDCDDETRERIEKTGSTDSQKDLSDEDKNSASSGDSGDKRRKSVSVPALSSSLMDSKCLSPIPMDKSDGFKTGSYIDEIQKIRL